MRCCETTLRLLELDGRVCKAVAYAGHGAVTLCVMRPMKLELDGRVCTVSSCEISSIFVRQRSGCMTSMAVFAMRL